MADETKRVQVVLQVKNDEFNRNIKETNNQIKLTKSELELAGKKLKEYGNNTKELSDKQKMLEQQIANTNDKMKLYGDNVAKNTTKLTENKKELELLSNKKKELATQLKESETLTGKESEQTQKLKGELTKLNGEYKEKENQIKNNVNAINKHNLEINKCESELVGLESELKRTNKALVENGNGFLKASKDFENAGTKLKATGSSISGIGGSIMGLSAPMAIAGVAIGKMSVDFEKGMANINTLLDNTNNLEGYKKAVIAMSNETGLSVENMTNGMYQAISSLGDGGKETEKIFSTMARSAKAGGAETSDAVNLISSVMKGYNSVSGETAKKISDLAFMTANLGVTTFPEMAKSMGEVTPLASALGTSMEDMFSVMATSTGVVGSTSEVTTKFKGLLEGLIKPTTDMSNLMAKYGYENGQAMMKAEGMSGVLKILKNETGGNVTEMGKLFGSSEALTLALSLTGEQYETFIDKNGKMQNSVGATDKALEKVSNTAGDRLTKSLNKAKNSFLESGDKLIPLVEGLSQGIEGVSNAISKMDAGTIASIAKFAMFSMAVGGVTKITGGFVSGLGSVCSGLSTFTGWLSKTSVATKGVETATSALAGTATTGVGGLATSLGTLSGVALPIVGVIGGISASMYVAKEATEIFNDSMITSTEEMGFVEEAFGRLTNTQMFSKAEMEKLGLTYREWSSSISPEVQASLDGIADKSRNLQLTIDQLNFDGIISQEDVVIAISKTDEWCKSIIDTINNNQPQQNEAVRNMFNVDGIVTEEEQKVLDVLNKSNQTKIQTVNDSAQQIKDITRQAHAENRELTAEELNLIQELNNKANLALLESMNISQEDRALAQNLFLEKCNTQSAEALSQSLINERTAMEEQKVIINEKYQAGIDILQAKIPLLQGEERKQAEEQLNNAISQRDKLLQNEQDKWDDIIGISNEKYPQYMGLINKYTGEELTRKDLKRQEDFEKTKSHYANINQVTEDGLYSMYNSNTKTWDKVTVKVDEATGEVIAMCRLTSSEYGYAKDSAVGYSNDITKAMDEEAQGAVRTRTTIIQALNEQEKTTVNSNGEVISSNGKVVASLKEIENQADGTKTGVLNLNGTPIEVQVNSDGTIKNIDEIRNAINNIPLEKTVTINIKEQRWASSASDGVDRGYYTGTSSATEGYANVNENGYELFDSFNNASRAISGQIAYLESGTKVTNHLQTTAMMQRDIKKEVNKQMESAISKAIEKLGDSKANKSANTNYYGDIKLELPNVRDNSTIDQLRDVFRNLSIMTK